MFYSQLQQLQLCKHYLRLPFRINLMAFYPIAWLLVYSVYILRCIKNVTSSNSCLRVQCNVFNASQYTYTL